MKSNRRMRLAAAITIGLAVSGLLAARSVRGQQTLDPRLLSSYTERVQTGFIDWGEGFAQVDVQAAYDTQRFGSSHAKIKAIGQAEKRADDALYRLIRGINVDGGQRLAGNPDLEQALKKIIPKARKMDIGKVANVTLNAKFTVPLFGKKTVASAIYDSAFAGSDEPATLPGVEGGGVHTSVLFDAGKTSLQAALFPRVLTESGDLIYGPEVLDPGALARGAPVRYLVRSEDTGKKKSGLSKALARAVGDNPLVIEVGKIEGEFLADIVLRQEQVAQLQQGQVADLLAEGLVFIIQTASIDATQP